MPELTTRPSFEAIASALLLVTCRVPVPAMVRSAIEKIAALGSSGSSDLVCAEVSVMVLVLPSASTRTTSSAAVTTNGEPLALVSVTESRTSRTLPSAVELTVMVASVSVPDKM